MFQRNQFRSSTTQTTTTTQKQRASNEETNQADHLLPQIHNYQQSEKHYQVALTNKSYFDQFERNDLPLNKRQPSSSSSSSLLLLKSSWLRRVALTVATLRLTATTSTATATTATTTAAAVTGGESIATLFKSLLAGCYYAIAFTLLLILILYINHFAIQESLILNNNNNNNQNESPSVESNMIKSSKDESNGSGFIALNYIYKDDEEDELKITLNYDDSIHLRTKRSPTNNSRRPVNNNNNHNNNNNNNSNYPYGSSPTNSNHRPSQGKTSTRNNNHPKVEQQHQQLQLLSSFSRLNKTTKPFLTTNEIKFDEHPKLKTEQQRYAIPTLTTSTKSTTTTTTFTTTNSLPELSERQADFSLNNRGSMLSSSGLNSSSSINSDHLSSSLNLPRETVSENSQWIPILVPSSSQEHRVNQAYVTTKPQRRKPSPAIMALNTNEIVEQRRPIQTLPIPINLIESTSYNIENNLPPTRYNYHYSRHQHQHHQMGSYHNRQWRRPRFNTHLEQPAFRQRAEKFYKRVLLCDKTLVSLDYVRSSMGMELPHDIPPYPGNHFNHLSNDHFDDNVIDLDSNLDPVLAATNQIRRINSHNNQSKITTSATSTTIGTNSLLLEPQILSESVKADDILAVERRSLLTDEDPLVKCDMWDLEKGLKNRKPPKDILQMAVKADFDTVRDAINRCRQLSEKNLPPDDEYRDGLEILSTEDLISLFSMKRGLIPGTKWCGLGDIASSYNDLGPKHRIDICCRAHDHCPIRLKPFRNDYGVLNIALYTKSHCDCDADFYRCLREARSRTADMLGNLYFNVMKLQCMHEERLKICREMKPIALGFERCVRYEESPVKTAFKFTTPPVAY